MTVLTGVLCSTELLTRLHNHGIIIGMHIQNVFIAKREERRFMSVLYLALSAFLYFKSLLQSIVDTTYLHIDKVI